MESTPRIHEVAPSRGATLQDQWRAIILSGRNVASYKFALAKDLLDLRPTAGSLVKLEDLALPFARQVCEHLRLEDEQATSASSTFLDGWFQSVHRRWVNGRSRRISDIRGS